MTQDGSFSASARAAYRAYAQRFEVSPLEVSLAARVRFLTVWRVSEGLAVSESHAQAVRQGLWKLTGVAYTGEIALLPPRQKPAPGDQQP